MNNFSKNMNSYSANNSYICNKPTRQEIVKSYMENAKYEQARLSNQKRNLDNKSKKQPMFNPNPLINRKNNFNNKRNFPN